ncbi:type III-B CRISPR module RAMP protein Cmr6 [Alloalcanivorax xenomutans]|uniref:type III-B CRISPR module RAMP protein Cmr6 n=1 Tax=Alloalcanivorax xenomutans TaxID=1094342 RepID=UPI003A7F89C8
MAVAAVPDYLGKDFSTASPGLRFGLYLQVWSARFGKETNKVEPLQRAGKLNDNDKRVMAALAARQQAGFEAIADSAYTLQLDTLATAPFTTGLGNAHPLENGFAFLNPYGLPYLPGSGVKGILRQAARELASGDWGEHAGWSNDVIAALFGSEDDKRPLRGALTFWDVIPQIKGGSLTVEIMTPHQKHYYQEGKTPHDAGNPIPLTFLTVPPDSGFTFYVQCNPALLKESAPALAANGQWKACLQAAFEHALQWLGFGAKTAVGYGAMQEDQGKKSERERRQSEKKEEARRAALSPEDLAYEQNRTVIDNFNAVFDAARTGTYQPGQEFDSRRNTFIEAATAWEEPRSRAEAAALLAETLKWGVSKKGKVRLKEALAMLKGEG